MKKWELCPKDLLRERAVWGIVLSYKTCLRACYQRHESVPKEGMFLFSPGKAMTACHRDYVSWGKMKPCMEVMSYMRSQGQFLGPCQPSEVCWDSSLLCVLMQLRLPPSHSCKDSLCQGWRVKSGYSSNTSKERNAVNHQFLQFSRLLSQTTLDSLW